MLIRHSQRILPPERPVTAFGEKLKAALEQRTAKKSEG